MNTTAGAAIESQQQQPAAIKRRAACDECRTKKLKCTGEQPNCARCNREGIPCTYSPQKQMGRPKKRARTEDDVAETAGNAEVRKSAQVGGVGWDNAFGMGSINMDMNLDESFTTPLTPGGGMQPWLQQGESLGIGVDAAGWEFGMPDVPGLTPDEGSNSNGDSPPTLNLPPELQQTNTHHRDRSTQLLLDPSLSTSGLNLGLPPSTLPSCACLSSLYLTLNTLQSMDQSFAFPFALHPLREAMQTASEVLACDACPTTFISSIQNTQLVGTLLMSTAERFGRVLEAITAECTRAETLNETKKFRLADVNTSTSHLHTGGLGCAAAFSIDLSPQEWKSMAKKVVKAEVQGPIEGNTCCPFFLGVTKQMTERQLRWHRAEHPLPMDCPRDVRGAILAGKHLPQEDHNCIKLAQFSEKLGEGFDWS